MSWSINKSTEFSPLLVARMVGLSHTVSLLLFSILPLSSIVTGKYIRWRISESEPGVKITHNKEINQLYIVRTIDWLIRSLDFIKHMNLNHSAFRSAEVG